MKKGIALAQIAGWCGIASPVLSLSLIFQAVAVSPWFDWHRNALSDLGVGASGALFNSATSLGGALTVVLILGLVRTLKLGRLGELGAVFALLGAVGLSLVGVFPEDRGAIHFAVALTYFFATPLGCLLIGLGLLETRRPFGGVLTVSAGLAALLLITRTPHAGNAVPEILAALVMGGWVFAAGMALLTE
jgi:hypothetical membrane protein